MKNIPCSSTFLMYIKKSHESCCSISTSQFITHIMIYKPLLSYIMSHLNIYIAKEKNRIRFFYVSYQRTALFNLSKLLIVPTGLLHKKRNNCCKIQHEDCMESKSLFLWAATFCHLSGLSSDLMNPGDICTYLLSSCYSAWSF
jgi:hypothetical protein